MKSYLAYILETEFGVTPRIERDGKSYYLHFDDPEIHAAILTNFEVVNGYFYSVGLAYQVIDPEDGDVRQKQFDNRLIRIEETKSIARQPLIFASTSQAEKQASAERVLAFVSKRLDALYIDRDHFVAGRKPDLKSLLVSVCALPERWEIKDFEVSLDFSVTANNASCKVASLYPNGLMTVLYMQPERVFIRHKSASDVQFPTQRFWEPFIAKFDAFFTAFAEDQPRITVRYSSKDGRTLTQLRDKYSDASTYLQIEANVQFDSIKALVIDDKIKLRSGQRYADKIHDLSVELYEFFGRMQNICTV